MHKLPTAEPSCFYQRNLGIIRQDGEKIGWCVRSLMPIKRQLSFGSNDIRL